METLNRLIKVSRPAWWFANIYFYTIVTSHQRYVFTQGTFWLGLLYVAFPLNILVFGLNDLYDIDVDKHSSIKGGLLGAKENPQWLNSMWTYILWFNLPSIIGIALIISSWVPFFFLAFFIFVNILYNMPPFRWSSRGYGLEIPCIWSGFGSVSLFSVVINQLEWPSNKFWIFTGIVCINAQFINEYRDYDSDKLSGRVTSITALSRPRAVKVLSLIGILDICLTLWLFEDKVIRFQSLAHNVMNLIQFGTNQRTLTKDNMAQVFHVLLTLGTMSYAWNVGAFL